MDPIQKFLFKPLHFVSTCGIILLAFIYFFGNTLQSAINDTPIRIVFTGNWGGKFISNNAQGGIASLHTYVQENKRQARAQNGDLLFLFSGDMTGTDDSSEYIQKINYPQFNLIEYLNFDAILFSPKEISYLSGLQKEKFRKYFQKTPTVSFNYRNLEKDANKILPYRIVPVSDLNVFVTAIGNGQEPKVDTNPLPRLFFELERQTGIDLIVLLMSQDKVKKIDTSESGFFSETKDDFSSTDSLKTKVFFKHLLGKQNQNTNYVSHATNNALINKMLVLISGTNKNKFYRHRAGPYVCKTKPGEVCQINLLMRSRVLIGLDQSFVNINKKNSSYSWIYPDRLLYETLK